MMATCLFCRIADGEIPAALAAENEWGIAFPDIAPQAPVHLLVIPRRHIASLQEADDPAELAGLLALVREVARTSGVAARGYRVVTNIGEEGGQSVPHLHFHVLGGRPLGWPPG